MKDDKLSEMFGIPQTPRTEIITKTGEVIPYEEETKKEQPKHDPVIDKDFEKIRSNLNEILSQGSDALYHALEVAKSSEHPRAFEVVANMMKQLSDINIQLLDAHKKHKDLVQNKSEEQDTKQQNVTNNAIFVGSTHELAKMIEDMKKGK